MDFPLVLTFHGEIDLFAKRRIERELERIESFGDDALTILDVSDVRYLDTTFLNALIGVRNKLMRRNPDVRICLVAPRAGIAWRLFEFSNLDAAFPLFDDVASARRSSFALMPPTLPASA